MSSRILVVEDQHSVRENIEELLEIKGFEVKSTDTAGNGLQMIETFIPDLIITDLMLPDFTGIELIEKLRNIDGLSETPVIIITGNDKPETFRTSMNRGADDYLSKPFKAQELYDSIASQLHKKEIRKENFELIAELSQQAPLPIIRLNQFGKIIYSNPAADQFDSDTLIDRIFKRLLQEDKTDYSFEFSHESQLFKVIATHNKIQGYYNVYFLDITAESNKNLELSRKNEIILLKNENLTQFAYIVSHDLKAPLINLRQLSDLMKENGKADLTADRNNETLINLFDQSLKKMEDVMNDLGEILKARDDKALNNYDSFLIHDQIERLCQRYQNQLTGAKAIIELKIDSAIELNFPIPSFNTIFKIILENSLRYKVQDKELKIEFTCKIIDNSVFIEIVDNSCSFLRSNINEINMLQYQPSALSTFEKGHGFQIIKNIMNSHDGDFKLSEYVDGGCLYILIFNN